MILKNKEGTIFIRDKGYYYSDLTPSDYFHAILTNEIKLPKFTAREIEVLKYSCTELSYAEIGNKMNTTHRSVEGYRDSLFRKLKVHNRSTLALFAVKYGFGSIDTSPEPGLLK